MTTQDPAPLALVVRFALREGAESAFDELVAATAAAIRDREPATLVYACHRVDGEPRQRVFYELYADRAAFDAHEAQPHVRHFLAARGELLDGFTVDFLTLADGKAPLPGNPA